MKNGTYGHGNTDFSKLVLSKFKASLYDSVNFSGVGCGASALALLTGENPGAIVKRNGGRDHYSTRFMLQNLRDKGFKTFAITKCNLTKRNKTETLNYQLKDNHLTLMSVLLKENEASWVCNWNEIQYHNFQLSKCNYWGLLNFPIVEAFVLWKKSWV